MQNILIGVIGHIDHGKTALVKALGGFEGDSTPEEKRRGITIDISFSHIQKEDTTLTFIDMPGHEDLVKNMIAGAFSVDRVMLVVSAKEGIKPQSVEHFHIARLLGIKEFLVVVSKKDLVEENVFYKRCEEIEDFFGFFGVKPIVMGSSIYDEKTIDAIKTELFCTQKLAQKSAPMIRYFIDRVFSIKGSGTVVTGTLLGGEIYKNDKLFVFDTEQMVQIKSIQTHNSQTQSATNGMRVALNLANIASNELARGMQIGKKGAMRGFKTIDVKIELLKNDDILHDNNYQLFVGSARYGVKVLEYGRTNQIIYGCVISDESMFCLFGDKFVLRDGMHTIGGGEVLASVADPMKKTQKLECLKLLEQRDFYKVFSFLTHIHKKGFGLASAPQRFAMTSDELFLVLDGLKDEFLIDKNALIMYSKNAQDTLEVFVNTIYTKNPYALLSAQFLTERYKWVSLHLAEVVLGVMEQKNYIVFNNGLYCQKEIQIDNIDKFIENKLYEILVNAKLTPEAPYNIYDTLELDRKTGDKAFKRLSSAKKIQRLAHNYYITVDNLTVARTLMKEIIQKDGYIDIHNFKANLDISRKYLIALLEYLDTLPFIKTIDNKRVMIS